MRLLHTTEFRFEDFFDAEIPKYAILSHRWGSLEVSYEHMRRRTAPPGPGLRKVENCCHLAAKNDLEWAWIDTCCIDKRSSAELSEAINSMFKWYTASTACYVYLSDVSIPPSELPTKRQLRRHDWDCGDHARESFRKSKWFARGWTLQELLAPDQERLTFFDADWNPLGSLHALARDIATVTGINAYYLSPFLNAKGSAFVSRPPLSVKSASVARRMSWAAKRMTSRGEDMAYCLLGLFDVNMPLLYGEGAERAFHRLQLEIIRNVDDESIFAWITDGVRGLLFCGLLAPNPGVFSHSGGILPGLAEGKGRRSYSMTKRGFELCVPEEHIPPEERREIPLFLNCRRENDLDGAVGIQLYRHRTHTYRKPNRFLDNFDMPPHQKRVTLKSLYDDLAEYRTIWIDDPNDYVTEQEETIAIERSLNRDLVGGIKRLFLLPQVSQQTIIHLRSSDSDSDLTEKVG